MCVCVCTVVLLCLNHFRSGEDPGGCDRCLHHQEEDPCVVYLRWVYCHVELCVSEHVHDLIGQLCILSLLTTWDYGQSSYVHLWCICMCIGHLVVSVFVVCVCVCTSMMHYVCVPL